MYNVKFFILCIYFFLLPFHFILFCVDIGSDNFVDRFTYQPTLNNGDRIAGFACLLAGLQLSSSSVSAIFDSYFPVIGAIDLQNGTLSLGRDLILHDVSSIVNFGNIIGNNKKIELAKSIEYFPEQDATGVSVELSNVSIFLNSDMYLNNINMKFTGNSVINGRGNCLTMSPISTMFVDSNSSLLFSDITIKDISGSKIYCTDNTSTMSVQNVVFEQNGNYNFNAGHFEILNKFHIFGDGYVFAYTTDQESIIASNAQLILDNNVTFSYAPSVSNNDLLILTDETSDIVLRGATLFSTKVGLQLTKGNILVERKSYFFCEGTKKSDAIILGDGASVENNVEIQCIGAANLEIINGYIVDDTVAS